jgi:pimeloyl-ACP methyl ester carboxylesterase
MGAAGFGTLGSHFADRTVVTYDPRGLERSMISDQGTDVTPEVHADDVHRLIRVLDAGPVDLFASSGGAINALALVAKHPADAGTVVAHEPPLVGFLPDREAAMAASRAVHQTYMRRGFGAGMAHFIALTSHKGPSRRTGRTSPPPIRARSACLPRTTARATIRCSGRTRTRSRSIAPTWMPSERHPPG